jgi:hypothetical protein
MWRSMTDATPPGQMQISIDHNKNSTTVQVCINWLSKYTIHGQVSTAPPPPSTWIWTSIKPSAGTYTLIKWLRRHTIPCPSQAETSVVGQQTSKPNATPHLWDHLWNTHLQTGAKLRIKYQPNQGSATPSCSFRLWRLPTNQQCYGDGETIKLNAAGSQM